MLNAEQWGSLQDKADEKVDGTIEAAVKKVIHVVIDGLLIWEETGWLSKAYKAFYAPQIMVFAKLVSTEIRYDPQWTQITQLRHAVDVYTDQLKYTLNSMPPIPPIPKSKINSANSKKMMESLDGTIRGSLNVFFACRRKIIEVNKFLQVHKPHNIFDLVLGQNGNFTARNGLCDSVKALADLIEQIADYRNRWAKTLGESFKRAEIRRRVQEECPETIF